MHVLKFAYVCKYTCPYVSDSIHSVCIVVCASTIFAAVTLALFLSVCSVHFAKLYIKFIRYVISLGKCVRMQNIRLSGNGFSTERMCKRDGTRVAGGGKKVKRGREQEKRLLHRVSHTSK